MKLEEQAKADAILVRIYLNLEKSYLAMKNELDRQGINCRDSNFIYRVGKRGNLITIHQEPK